MAIDEERVRHEARERADRDAPRWAPISEHEEAWWISDDNNLRGTLVNVGSVQATVTDVDLDLPAGGGLPGRFRAHPTGPADGGFVSELDVRPGGALAIHFETTDGSLRLALHGDVRPRMRITARSDEIELAGHTHDRVAAQVRRRQRRYALAAARARVMNVATVERR